MKKLELKRQLKHLYRPSSKQPVLVDVPAMNFLMADGAGDPDTAADFQEAVEALYSVSYTLKFAAKMGPLATDYPVMALEGLWWADDMREFTVENRAAWQWTLMIMQPDIVTEAMFVSARAQVESKKNPPALRKLRFERFHEGLSAQIMHIGPYSGERPAVEKLQRFIRESGCELRGKHHEIYLSDPRRAKPENLRTVIRQPVA
ncbi:MAG: GyrI-like domain-containing protein [Armatimonadota bacterium]|nr:MAG: GyrI-like domain-containing protein [Armatimonadota bacterium]